MTIFCILYSTFPSKKEAQNIAKELLKMRFAACVNILGKTQSMYQWKGKVESSTEFAMIIKTRKNLSKKAMQCIRKHHSYQVPAILELAISAGDDTYLKWMLHETRV